MVQALHNAGFEVIPDLVFNHTFEGCKRVAFCGLEGEALPDSALDAAVVLAVATFLDRQAIPYLDPEATRSLTRVHSCCC